MSSMRQPRGVITNCQVTLSSSDGWRFSRAVTSALLVFVRATESSENFSFADNRTMGRPSRMTWMTGRLSAAEAPSMRKSGSWEACTGKV